MAIRPPVLNLLCNIWQHYGGTFPITLAPSQAGVRCQLRTGTTAQQVGVAFNKQAFSLILFPPLTDVRGIGLDGIADVIECPAGTGRYYQVQNVEDRGKGFLNETRSAVCKQITNAAGGWPYPTP